MPSKAQMLAQMADHAATQITGSHKDWTDFLTTVARLYKYPYNEQLMIYAQKPEATACAEYGFWNDKMRRYVRRGTKGIALLDTTGDKPRLKYVFDVSDTGGSESSRPFLWELRQEHADSVSAMLERNYEVPGGDGLHNQLERIAAQLSDEYWNEHGRDILGILEDSFLEEYDDFNVGVQFRNAATVSITYTLMSRCGLEPENYFEHEDFLSIFDFNTPETVAALGTVVSEINQRVLRQIEITVKNYEREHIAERSAINDRVDLHPKRGLSDSRSDDSGAERADRQIREDAQELSEGASPDTLEQPASEREAVPAPAGDRPDGELPFGANDAEADESGGSDGESESKRPDEMGRLDEQPESTSGGNNPFGADLQLRAEQLTLFPSEDDQIQYISEAESVSQTPFAFSFKQDEIDHVLRLGSNTNNSRMRITSEFEKGKSLDDIAEFLKSEYHGGTGLKTGYGDLSAWYSEDGIHLSQGSSARYQKSAQVIPWRDAAERIGELLKQGQFATNVELAETDGFERSQLAQAIWYLCHDLSDEAREQGYFNSLQELGSGGFPDETACLAEQLAHSEFRTALVEEYQRFIDDLDIDRNILRFHYHRPAELFTHLKELGLPRREYATDMMALPEMRMFITEDEINETLTRRGSGVEGGKNRIYAFFTASHTPKEQVDFLKNEYGIGGSSHAVSRATGSHEDHSSKGIKLNKGDCTPIELAWSNVARRITDLIRKDRYLSPEEKTQYEEIRREKAAEKESIIPTVETATTSAYSEYEAIKDAYADDIVLYQVGDFYEMYGEDAKKASQALDLTLTTRNIGGNNHVLMCGIPSNRLEQYVTQLRDNYDVTISGIEQQSGERRVFSLHSVDHEADQAINAHRAEYASDGYRVFPGNAPEETETPPASVVSHTEITQDDINAALQHWNGNMASKRRVQNYMQDHARDKNTAAWLSCEFNGTETKSLFISVTGTELETELPWPKVQRRIAQLIHEDRFFTEQEFDNFENVDAAAIREALNSPEAQERADSMLEATERIASENATPPYERFSVIETEKGYAIWDDIRDEIYVDDEGVSEEFTSEWQAEDYLKEVRKAVSDKEAAEWLYVEQSKVAPTLTPEQQIIVNAMEAAGFQYSPADARPESSGNIVFRDSGGYPLTYETWDEVYDWIDGAELKEIPGLRETIQSILHPDAETSQERRKQIIAAMEAADLHYDEIDSYDGYLVFRGDANTITFQSWDEAAEWIDGVVFDDPERGTAAERIMHPERFSEPEPPTPAPAQMKEDAFPYSVGDTIYLEDGKVFIIENIGMFDIRMRDPTLFYPIFRAESRESFARLMERYPQPEHEAAEIQPEPENFRITDDNLGVGGTKAKFRMNMDAINTLKQIELEGRTATPEEQEVLAKYAGWGGLADAFDESKLAWANEFKELYATLSPEEYAAARSSTLNAHYTSPTVINAIYEAIGNMGFTTGNILEPAMGVGNFFGCLPQEMSASKLYGVELDSITGRIAKQLYPKADIAVAGFETTDRRDFFDLAIGNVPFGQYQVNDRAYNKLGFSIHDYFFAKTLDQVRAGGVIAFITSRYTMDKQSPEVRRYIAERAELLGAIRLPNNAFRANAGTDVVSDIIFLQKRDHPITIDEDWIHLGKSENGYDINSYFAEHPEMVLGKATSESTQYGRQDYTVAPIEGAVLSEQLHEAVSHIGGQYMEAELPDLGEGIVYDTRAIDTSIPADPNVKNYSYTVVDGDVYYRENSRMVRPDLNITAKERVIGLVELRNSAHKLIDQQLDGYIPDSAIRQTQAELNRLYNNFTDKYGTINSRGNALAFADDSSYYLLCSLEVLDEEGNLERKADMFTKRTIRAREVVTSVDTASEALALSIAEKAHVDLPYMQTLTGFSEEKLVDDLRGVIFRLPEPVDYEGTPHYVTADEYLSGNVREKLRDAECAVEISDVFAPNVEALTAAQPKDLDASEIEIRLGATWVDKEYIQQFMLETFNPPYYLRRSIEVNYSPFTAEWNITGKNQPSYSDVNAYMTYGTDRANAYRILEDTLNLRDIRIYDTVTDPDGKERRVLNSKETTLAGQKQQAIKDAFREWIWKGPERRQTLCKKYNEMFNSCRPREYDGRHITFSGMNPEISLREHQLNAVAHILYGGNTLLAHEVGAGKTFEMVAAVMEAKRLGLCQKSLFVVPNHLTEQWASEFLRLYPSANILVATKKDFETHNRKKFCARIATGDYDAVIIGHSQFERIPVSQERQERLLQEQIDEIAEGLEELKSSRAERFTIKQLERTKKSLEARLEKLSASDRKDDVVTFEQLGVDRLYVDEAHAYKNLFLYTKMRNVAGLSASDAQKSSDMYLKCRYMDELTHNKGVIFATGTPVSNSMTELYTMMRYLQHDTLQERGLSHFDAWASTFGETTTAIELAPEGTGYRARTRFSKFFNLPELMTLFKEVADIKTQDQLDLPRPEAVYHNEVTQPTNIQQEMVQDLSERAAVVHSGTVDPSVDNMLKITSDGRKLGLDQRVVNSLLPDEENSKVNRCVGNIYHIWEDGQADKLTQLVFCDISTPKASAAKKVAKAAAGNLDSPELHALETLVPEEAEQDTFTVYSDIRDKLVERGIPAEQIAFIHDANTEVRKKELFAKVRSGQVRVLMGSTFKMGAGMNVQDRLVALHDLDCPWRPGDLEQRSGRIIRQGNHNKQVHIFRYVTEKTFDSYLWQTVENKQKFISQIMTSKSPVRACEDIDETALSYAEIKALCAGDERIKEKMDLDIDVARLRVLKADHQSKQFRLEDNLLKTFPEQVERSKGFIAGFEADMKTLSDHPHPKDGFAGMEVKGDNLTDKDNAGAAILEACKEAKGLEPLPIGSYRGFAMSLTVEDFGRDLMLTLKGQMSHRVSLGKDARGNLTRIDNALAQMPERLATVQSKLDNTYQQIETAKAELSKPFPQDAELAEKSARLAQLNIELDMAGKTPQPNQQTLAKTERSSLLERIKTPCVSNAPTKKKTHEIEER